MELFLGADDQVELRQDVLQVGGDAVVGNEARFAIATTGQAPQHRAIVDIQDGAHTVLACVLKRACAGRVHAGGGKVRARDGECARRGNKGFVDIRRLDGHVGAVLAIEDQRKSLAILDAEQDQTGQPLWIAAYVADIAADAAQCIEQEATHVVVAHARQHRRAQAQARRTERAIAR